MATTREGKTRIIRKAARHIGEGYKLISKIDDSQEWAKRITPLGAAILNVMKCLKKLQS